MTNAVPRVSAVFPTLPNQTERVRLTTFVTHRGINQSYLNFKKWEGYEYVRSKPPKVSATEQIHFLQYEVLWRF